MLARAGLRPSSIIYQSPSLPITVCVPFEALPLSSYDMRHVDLTDAVNASNGNASVARGALSKLEEEWHSNGLFG